MPIELDATQEPVLHAIFEYWQMKRGTRAMPSRRDLDPVAEIPRLAPYLILVDTALRPADFRFRLYGSRVSDGFGEDRTGWTLGQLSHIEHYEDVVAGYWQVHQERGPLYTPYRPVSTVKDHTAYSRLLLPLSGDGSVVDMILGGIVFHESSWIGQTGHQVPAAVTTSRAAGAAKDARETGAANHQSSAGSAVTGERKAA